MEYFLCFAGGLLLGTFLTILALVEFATRYNDKNSKGNKEDKE